MAARRLLIIMVVLLTISTLAAALVPAPEQGEQSSTSTSATKETSTGERPPGSELVRAEVPVPRSGQAPREVELEPGDQLALMVTSGEPGEVSLPDFGLVEFAGPGNPASFDLLIEEEGGYPVRFQGAGTVATIVAENAKPKRSQS